MSIITLGCNFMLITPLYLVAAEADPPTHENARHRKEKRMVLDI
jgi:hypothetical protein